MPHKSRFPNGLDLIVDKARGYNIDLGLWFHPSNHNGYENWKQDSEILVHLYREYGIKYFKIDGIKLDSKRAEMNLRKFFSRVMEETNGMVSFNLDATADKRGGYHYLYEYGGNIFLENRYTDWANYYPYWTLRNLWMLSKYIQPEKLQIEFLNPFRNKDKYPKGDCQAPAKIPLDYQFAITIPGQPLAWFEASGIPHRGQEILKPLIKEYHKHSRDFHEGIILPIGEEPSGRSWTGFQSIHGDTGFFLVFREFTEKKEARMDSWLAEGEKIHYSILMGSGSDFSAITGANGKITFALPSKHSFALYKYRLNAK